MRSFRRGRRHISRDLSAFCNVTRGPRDVTHDPMQPFTVGGMLGGGGIRVRHDQSVEPASLGAFQSDLGHMHGLEREEGRAWGDLERVVRNTDLDVWGEAVQDVGDHPGVLQRGGLLECSSHLSVGEEAVRCGLEGERGGGKERKRCQEAWDALAKGDHIKVGAGRGPGLRRGCCVWEWGRGRGDG